MSPTAMPPVLSMASIPGSGTEEVAWISISAISAREVELPFVPALFA